MEGEGPTEGDLDAVELALTIRECEQRLLRLFADGEIAGTVHTCLGQEFTGIAVARALAPGDFVCSNHRGHGHYLARTGDLHGLVAEVMGRTTGLTGGRGGSQHMYRDDFYSNGILGGMAPIATGMALAERMRGSGRIGCLFLGDGAFGEGVVYEALNIASKLAVPLLIVIEDNGYAQSTRQEETLAGTLLDRPRAFGIPVHEGSTWEWRQLMGTIADAASSIRAGCGPRACIVRTYRLGPHSKGDDDRGPAELARHQELDPLAQLLATGDPTMIALAERARQGIDAAVEAATNAPRATDLGDVAEACSRATWVPAPIHDGRGRVVEEIRSALDAALDKDTDAIVLGEDVRSPYGGAFKATRGLSDRFPDRVLNMPISEQAIVGVSTGLALRGMRPFAEVMFGDFMALAFDQILNHAAKFRYMYADRVSVPLVVRTAMGGRRGYGPTHSQSLEKHFLGIPGTRVIAINHRTPIGSVYRHIAETDRPTIVFEYKTLYGRPLHPAPPPGFDVELTQHAYPWVCIAPRGYDADLTIVTFGDMVSLAEEAATHLFDEHEIVAQVIAPTQLFPLDIAPVVEKLKPGSGLLVVEEGQETAGFGAEVLAQLMIRSDPHVRARRVAARPIAIPSARTLEDLALPSLADIVTAGVELVHGV